MAVLSSIRYVFPEVDDDTLDELVANAAEKGVTPSEAINEALDAWPKPEKKKAAKK